mmetsp:Transcript_44179/g.58639  ORF Transcript_44179/g.58639 Transcript_44179/m.58639 type:complete len:128 (+) Transcript_44179:1547-1930(+)
MSTDREGARTAIGTYLGQIPASDVIMEEDVNSRRNLMNYSELNSVDITESVAVLEKNEVVSAGFVARHQKNAIEAFAWDPNYASDVIAMRSMNRSIFLKEEQYLFRTVIGDKSFSEGLHYWEIVADA